MLSLDLMQLVRERDIKDFLTYWWSLRTADTLSLSLNDIYVKQQFCLILKLNTNLRGAIIFF